MPIGYRVQTYTTTGTMQSWNMDYAIAPMSAAIRVTVTGTATYGLQWTLTPLGPQDADTIGNWVPDSNITSATTISASTTYNTPVARIRLVITALTGTSSLAMESLQGYSTN